MKHDRFGGFDVKPSEGKAKVRIERAKTTPHDETREESEMNLHRRVLE